MKSLFSVIGDALLAILAAFIVQVIIGLFGITLPFYLIVIMCFACRWLKK